MVVEGGRGVLRITGSEFTVIQAAALKDIVHQRLDHSVLLITFIEP